MTLNKRFFKKFHGEGKFPKRISDPILCDEIVEFINKEIDNILDNTKRQEIINIKKELNK